MIVIPQTQYQQLIQNQTKSTMQPSKEQEVGSKTHQAQNGRLESAISSAAAAAAAKPSVSQEDDGIYGDVE